MNVKKTRKLTRFQLIMRGLLPLTLILALLLLSAGRWNYWQAWLYIVVNGLLILSNLWLLRNSPDLIDERLKPGAGMKRWDKIYFILSTPIGLLMLILAGLDAGRFGWTGPLPIWSYALFYALYLAGQALFIWAKTVNRYFSSVVRIQTDRGQQVCTSGPYHYVRHPGYLGALIYTLTGGLVLGSIYAVIPQLFWTALLVIRTDKEDRLLQAELPGYSDYVKAVRYRLIPGIW